MREGGSQLHREVIVTEYDKKKKNNVSEILIVKKVINYNMYGLIIIGGDVFLFFFILFATRRLRTIPKYDPVLVRLFFLCR